MEVEKGQDPSKETELDKLKKHSLVVADTGDFNLIEKYHPEDSTTNPTLINQVTKKPQFKHILDNSIDFGIKNFQQYCCSNQSNQPAEWEKLSEEQRQDLIALIFDHICVSFGCEILKRIKGYVSTEVDASLSFNKNETVKRAKRIIALYEQAGVNPDRVLIKIATTWEGIKAAEVLAENKIKVNMTLIFHMVQAVACADSKLFLISPFIGRILDWNKKQFGKTYENPLEDPGVVFVTDIFNYYCSHNIKTIIMGASFRNTDEIKYLSGVDRLTIAPALLDKMQECNGDVPLKLNKNEAAKLNIQDIKASEEEFRHQMNKSKMATDLFSAGIRSFEDAGNELKALIRKSIIEKKA